ANVSAAGKVLLAPFNHDELDDLFARHNLPSVPDDAERKVLYDELKSVRSRGYATNMGEREPGVHAVAVPVLDLEGHPVAAIAIAAPSARLPYIRIEGLVKHLRTASTAITTDYYAVG